ncbi:hypothetical protein [Rhodopirellula sp. MGV]|uniref:hypothetical protein n=1 Tax=Rhodopirellula sp. MGV TaxID=2023130 RepID=UPI000B97A1A3|nr:hypothetical protein [Rhodopirellula sp. MGV]OYP30411.1 hypothetical protein CGZ80_22415 [Rhodopirellula sp. MGV]PNY35056.1 hypothetical protein C2E31_20320 [Rhodopirellula baltica]PNY36797.1 hypothetical protein C2E31_11130 [Rhodopirellula baltica]
MKQPIKLNGKHLIATAVCAASVNLLYWLYRELGGRHFVLPIIVFSLVVFAVPQIWQRYKTNTLKQK